MNYLIYGSSYNLINAEIKNIVKDNNYDTYNLDETTFKELIENMSYDSMFEEQKTLVVKNFNLLFTSKKDNSDDIEVLKNYLNDSKKSTTMIFISSEKINERSKINKEILSKLNIIKTPVITKAYELAKIFNDVIRKDGYAMPQNTLNVFCEKCASNYDIAVNEFNKLKLYKKDNKLITEDDVENYVCNYNLTDSFGFKDAVINKNIDKAMKMIDTIESSKMEILPLVVMLAKEYQIVYNIKMLAKERNTNDQISTKLDNMHPYRVKLLRDAGNKYTEEELLKDILYLCNLDLKLVSEDNLGYDELRKFILEL